MYFCPIIIIFCWGGGGGYFKAVKAGLYFDPQLVMMQIEIWIQQVAGGFWSVAVKRSFGMCTHFLIIYTVPTPDDKEKYLLTLPVFF